MYLSKFLRNLLYDGSLEVVVNGTVVILSTIQHNVESNARCLSYNDIMGTN